MLDVLARCWGADAKQWVGRKVTLYNDPDVMFGKDRVGGVRVSHLSHIDGTQTVNIRASGRGRSPKPWKVEPLPDAPADTSQVPAAVTAINNAATLDALNSIETHARTLGISAHPDVVGALEVRKKELA
jgi:hypothetical protein